MCGSKDFELWTLYLKIVINVLRSILEYLIQNLDLWYIVYKLLSGYLGCEGYPDFPVQLYAPLPLSSSSLMVLRVKTSSKQQQLFVHGNK
jgi:hypothetical protein